jgi:N-acetylmuramic acid 6-phosphate etherase
VVPTEPTSTSGADRLDDLVTESRPEIHDYDDLSTLQLVELMNRGDAEVPDVVAGAGPELAATIDAVVAKLGAGGRLVYVGAGTSGHIADLDASESESTFSTPPGQIVALVAGAGLESTADRDATEDDRDAGAESARALGVSSRDAVIGVSASGRTPYVLGVLEVAAAMGAATACVVSAPGSPLARLVEHEIGVVVGPEFIAGSTRLRAGTAQKLVLNTISTVAMIRLGKTYGDLMVDVAGTNEKLRARARLAVKLATGAGDEEVEGALVAAEGEAKVAIVALLAKIDVDTARARLERSGGRVAEALR